MTCGVADLLHCPSGAVTGTQDSFLRLLASYRDVFYPKVDLAHHDEIRAAIALHAMNHVLKFVALTSG